jgi:AmmeMemoRadiSam system protein B
MRLLPLLSLLVPVASFAQATLKPAGTRPTLEVVRRGMAIPSAGDLRGQLDGEGYPSKAEAMAKLWELSALPPAPEALEPAPAAGLLAAITPHDDYYYAGRVDRQILPLVTAKTVVVVGVFHEHRPLGVRDQLVFDPYRAWRSPDGEIKVSALRDELVAQLPRDEAVKDAAAHDSEHSVEATVYFLKHQRPDLEIVPVLVPSSTFSRFQTMAAHLGQALAAAMKKRGWQLGRDVAIVISSDGVHYGPDFKYVPFGDGSVDAYQKALAQDRALMKNVLGGPLATNKARTFFATTVNPDRPGDEYRLSWCGRFSVPFGLLFLDETAHALGLAPPIGVPVALGTSIGSPALRVPGIGPTAPANLYHFVSHPAVAYH